MPPTRPSGNKIVKLKGYWDLDFKGFPNKHSFLTTNDVGSQENSIGPQQTRVSGWQSEGEWGSQCVRDGFRVRANATGAPFLTSLKPSQKGCHHTMIGWEGNMPQAASTPQSGVSLPTCAQVIWPQRNQSWGKISTNNWTATELSDNRCHIQQWQHPWGGHRVCMLTTVFVLG